jgi:tRNA pseudouridine55 synthase
VAKFDLEMFGFLNVAKPTGMTSHDVVSQIRGLTKVKQVGHAGTLDRLATGVLPIAIGPACRLIRFLGTDKVYTAEILLGTRTATDDTEGDVIAELPVPKLEENALLSILQEFVGEQDQVPPTYSAIHYEGKRLYELARADKLPDEIRPRRVNIRSIELLNVDGNTLNVKVECSGGTYIRSLARDLGDRLGCGGCISNLRRDKSGPFVLANSLSLPDLRELAAHARLTEALIEPIQVLGFETVALTRVKAWQIAAGQVLDLCDIPSLQAGMKQLVAITFEDALIAICSSREDNKLYPEVVLSNARSLA